MVEAAALDVIELGQEHHIVGARPCNRHGDIVDDAARAGAHDQDSVAECDGLVDIMGDEQDGDADFGPYVEQNMLHHRSGLRVERAKRLVHQQNAWIVSERAGYSDALLHAPGQLFGKALAAGRQAHPTEQFAADALRFI